LLVNYLIFHYDLNMDEQETQVTFSQQIADIWINPELERRKRENILPDNFKLLQCLIRLPKGTAPIIEFNDEIGWNALIKKPEKLPLEVGKPIYVHEIIDIVQVKPPLVNEERVAFIFVYWNGYQYNVVFDTTPNFTTLSDQDDVENWPIGKIIANHLQYILKEKTMYLHDSLAPQFSKIGLWAAPSLLPYPLSEIAYLLSINDTTNARRIFVEYCTSDFIEQLSSTWFDNEIFNKRKQILIDAIYAHKIKKFTLSINTILPQIEGIITDWLYAKYPEEIIPWKQESKTKLFKNKTAQAVRYIDNRINISTADFIISGPLLETFNEWLGGINLTFPNRHVVTHGKYDPSIYTEESSIKLFILIDTLYYIITYNEKAYQGTV